MQVVPMEYITNGMVKISKQFHINVFGCKNLTFYNMPISSLDEPVDLGMA